MRWWKPHPKRDDTRIISRFALLPTRLSDGYLVWLEKYEVRQRYDGGPHSGFYWYTMQTGLLQRSRLGKFTPEEAAKFKQEYYGNWDDEVSER